MGVRGGGLSMGVCVEVCLYLLCRYKGGSLACMHTHAH